LTHVIGLDEQVGYSVYETNRYGDVICVLHYVTMTSYSHVIIRLNIDDFL